MNAIAKNLLNVQTRMWAATAQSGRSADAVTLVAVTKSVDVADIAQAVELGIGHLGENRVQEAVGKISQFAREKVDGLCWHMIGHLQSNKINKVAQLFSRVDSLFRWDIVAALDRRLETTGKTMDVLLELKLSEEPNKTGASQDEALKLVARWGDLKRLRLLGLMTMAPWPSDEKVTRDVFRRCAGLFHRINSQGIGGGPLSVLSMGMSGDFEIAIEEGATEVRLGQALFGRRIKG